MNVRALVLLLWCALLGSPRAIARVTNAEAFNAGASTPMVLLPYQQRWLADTSRVRIYEKSRRIGVSWATGADAVIDGGSANGCDTWYVGYNHDMAQEFVRDCADWARKFNTGIREQGEFLFHDEDGDTDILAFTIRFRSNFRITALSSRPTNLRGKKGHIIIDEAAFHPDLKGLLKSAMAVKMWGGKGRVSIISTHNGTDSHFQKVLEEVAAGKRPYSHHRTTVDDALAAGLYRRICLVNNEQWTAAGEAEWRATIFAEYGDDADEELLCIPARSGGVYIQRDDIERSMRAGDVFRLELKDDFTSRTEASRVAEVDQWCKTYLAPALAKLPKDRLHYFGEDFGRTRDRTVIVPLTLAQNLQRVTPFVLEMLNVPYEQQKQVLIYLVDRLPRFQKGVLDNGGNGGFLAESAMLKYGKSKIELMNLSEPFYTEWLPKLRRALQESALLTIKDADHLLDLSMFKTINGRPKLPSLRVKANDDGPPRHGDAGVAYLLALYAASRPIVGHDGYQSGGKVGGGTGAFSSKGGIL